MSPAWLIVGLGNPGKDYAGTRHNAGFWCIDHLAEAHDMTLSDRRRNAVIGEGTIAGIAVALVKPRTFVNRSGLAARYLLDRYGASSGDLLVIHDDMNLPLGKLRLRAGGSAGGHNGINSIIQAIGSREFPRLRLGIGSPPSPSEAVEHVLGAMTNDEHREADEMIERAAKAVETVVAEGISVAMNRFN